VTDVRLTDHARERAAEMRVPTKEVKRALREPEMTFDNKRAFPDASRIAIRGRLAVPYNIDAMGVLVAITVLWSNGNSRHEGALGLWV